MAGQLQCTFDQLDPAMPNPEVYTIFRVPDEKVRSNLHVPSTVPLNQQVLRSRVKPNIAVAIGLSREQANRTPLSPGDLQASEEIYCDTASLKMSHDTSMSELFGNPFNITLIKKNANQPWCKNDFVNDERNPKKGGSIHPPSDRQQQSEIAQNLDEKPDQEASPSSQKTPATNGEQPTEESKTLDDLVNSVKMDEMTQRVIKNRWLNQMRALDEYRIKVGVAPFYLLESKESVRSFTPVDQPTGEDDDEYDDEYNYDDEEEEEEMNVEKSNDQEFLTSNPTTGAFRGGGGGTSKKARKSEVTNHPMGNNVGYNLEEWHETPDKKVNGDFQQVNTNQIDRSKAFRSKTIPNDFRKSSDNAYYGSTSSRDNPLPFSSSSVSKNTGVGKMLQRLRGETGDQASYSDAADLFGIPLAKQGSVHHIPFANQVYNSKLGEENGMAENVKKLADNSNGNIPTSAEIKFDGEDVNTMVGGITIKELRERKQNDDWVADMSNTLRLGDPHADEVIEQIKKKQKQNATKPGEIDSNIPQVAPGKTGGITPFDVSTITEPGGKHIYDDQDLPGGTETTRMDKSTVDTDQQQQQQLQRGKKRKRKGFNVSKIETVMTHNVPVVPPLELGKIEVYYSLSGPRYVWVWKTKDEFEGKPEPFMMWVIFNHASIDGKINSPISSLIGDYHDYQAAKKDFESASSSKDVPLFIVERVEPKAQSNNNGALGQDNYIPFIGSATGGGGMYNGPSLNLNDVDFMRSQRENMYGGLHMRPRSYLPEDGVNARPGWDGGRLVDVRSDEYRAMLPNVQMARHLNSQAGFGTGYITGRGNNRTQPSFYQLPPIGGMGGGGGGMMLPSAEIGRRMSYYQYDQAAAAHMQQLHYQQAMMTASLLNRPSMYTPQGNFIFLQPGEKITRLDKPKTASADDVNACKDKLERMGSLVGGSPSPMMLGNVSKKGNGPDGVFTSKTGKNESSYGLSVTPTSLSPNEKYRDCSLGSLKNIYSSIISDIFVYAYRNVIDSQDTWYSKMVEETFRSEIASMKRRAKRNGYKGNLKVMDIPDFESMFEVNITFPASTGVVGSSKALDLYKLGFYTPEEVFIEFLSEMPGSMKNNEFLQLITDTNAKSDMTYSARLERFSAGLKQALEHDKKKDIKEPSTNNGKPKAKANKAKKKKKAEDKGKSASSNSKKAEKPAEKPAKKPKNKETK